jgi:hypothetical protein
LGSPAIISGLSIIADAPVLISILWHAEQQASAWLFHLVPSCFNLPHPHTDCGTWLKMSIHQTWVTLSMPVPVFPQGLGSSRSLTSTNFVSDAGKGPFVFSAPLAALELSLIVLVIYDAVDCVLVDGGLLLLLFEYVTVIC